MLLKIETTFFLNLKLYFSRKRNYFFSEFKKIFFQKTELFFSRIQKYIFSEIEITHIFPEIEKIYS